MPRKINGGGHGQLSVLPTSVCDTTNNYSPMEERYSGLIFQHVIENVLNVSQTFINLLHQSTKTHVLFGQFPNRHNGNKESYDSIDTFLHW